MQAGCSSRRSTHGVRALKANEIKTKRRLTKAGAGVTVDCPRTHLQNLVI